MVSHTANTLTNNKMTRLSRFIDDQDDGVKGQDIIEPDEMNLDNVIRVDASKYNYGAFYQPRDNVD